MAVPFRRGLIAAAAALALSAPSAHAAVMLFSDNFEGDAATSVLNFNAFANWTVGDGTVDYIRSGGFGIACVGGSGGCVDIDGSTSNGGRMLTRSLFDLVAGETYRMLIDYSGNQRGGARDQLTFGLDGPALFSATSGLLDPSAPFVTDDLQVSLASDGSYRLFVETTSNDNVGPIVDNVRFECLTCGGNVQVPEPGALALLGIGAAAFAMRRRRA